MLIARALPTTPPPLQSLPSVSHRFASSTSSHCSSSARAPRSTHSSSGSASFVSATVASPSPPSTCRAAAHRVDNEAAPSHLQFLELLNEHLQQTATITPHSNMQRDRNEVHTHVPTRITHNPIDLNIHYPRSVANSCACMSLCDANY